MTFYVHIMLDVLEVIKRQPQSIYDLNRIMNKNTALKYCEFCMNHGLLRVKTVTSETQTEKHIYEITEKGEQQVLIFSPDLNPVIQWDVKKTSLGL